MFKNAVLLVSFVALSTSAFAVDGVTLINQATVLGSGGFPYTISQPGSYKLSGNLVVPSTVAIGINITAANVSLDLNGFTISCSGCSIPIAIESNGTGTNIVNGTVTGFPYIAIFFETTGASVDHMNLVSDGEGIVANYDLAVSNSTFVDNSTDGIAVNSNPTSSLVVTNSKFVHNFHFGIYAPNTYAAVVTGSVFANNGNAGQVGGTSGGVSVYSGSVTASSFVSSYASIVSTTGPVIYSQNSFYPNRPLGAGMVSAGNNGCLGISGSVVC
jgi:hypothetical protein